ncbi:MAG: glutathione S-transferase family protein [Hyphomicrobiaceae bacterium]
MNQDGVGAAGMTNGIIVHGIVSSRAMRVHWALQELGLSYRTERVQSRSGQTLSNTFTKLNPRQKIPVLQDDDFVLTESAAIVTYLGDRYGRPDLQLVPTSLRDRARYNEWVSFISMELDATSLYVVRRHEGLPEIYGAAPHVSQSCRAYFSKQIDAVVTHFTQNQYHLLDSGFSGVDILMTTCLDWALRVGIRLPNPILEYRNNVADRRGYLDALMANESPEATPHERTT